MKEQKKVNPLATESEGKLIAKFAIPAIISMLVRSLSDRESDFWEMQRLILHFLCRLSVRQQHFFLESEVRRILICVPEREIMRKQAGLRGPGFPCW